LEFESEDRVGTQSNRSQKPVIWLTCQLAGLMGRVTRRRANQVTSSLTQHGLVRADEQRHVLTNDGLTYLAHRIGPPSGWLWTGGAARKRCRSRETPRSSREPPCAPCRPSSATRTPLRPSPPRSAPRPPVPGTTACWNCCPRPGAASATTTRAPATWCTPTPRSGWTLPIWALAGVFPGLNAGQRGGLILLLA
jgi:hypothetical protein